MNSSLLFIKSSTPYTSHQVDEIKRAMRNFAKSWKASPVFEIRAEGEKNSYGAAISFDDYKSPTEILSVLKALEARAGFQVVLLSIRQILRMDPQCVLPHPLLVEDQAILAISAEIMPQYYHPISQMTLSEIYGKQKNRMQIEFFDTTIQIF